MSGAGAVATAILLACGGAVLALVVPRIGRLLGYVALSLSSLAAFAGVISSLHLASWSTLGIAALHLIVRVDATSAAFIAIMALVTLATSLYALGGVTSGERGWGRSTGLAANVIWAGSLVVCAAGDVWFFLFGWEVVALGFYLAIAYAGRSESGNAAYYTLVLTHVAGGGVVAALLLLSSAAHSFAVPDVAAAGASVAPGLRAALFLLLLFGFGAKVGLLPLQGWLPYGYPAAPPALAALMAGAALNVGFYGFVRFLIGFGGAVPMWWGLLVIALGALGAFFGIAWAQAQRDIRPLAAFSSIENAGLIVIGFGIALLGRTVGLHLMIGLGLAVAYVQIAAHAFAKALLFLTAAGIQDALGTTSFERLGGLLRRMPVHALAGLIAAMSLAALPPLAGFAGEWLTLEACMQGFRTANAAAEVTTALAGAAIGIAAGIAVVAFVKFVGVGLLGAPRSAEAERAREKRGVLRVVALAILAIAIVGLGVGTPWYLRAIAPAIDGVAGAAVVANITTPLPLVQPAFGGFASASGLGLGVTIAIAGLAFALLVALIPRPQTRRVQAWTSGGPYAPWTQYTGTGFSNPTRVILDVAVRALRTVHGSIHGSGSEEAAYESAIRPYFDQPIALAIARAFLRVAKLVRKTQSGIIAAYLSYILVFVIIALMFYPSIRRW